MKSKFLFLLYIFLLVFVFIFVISAYGYYDTEVEGIVLNEPYLPDGSNEYTFDISIIKVILTPDTIEVKEGLSISVYIFFEGNPNVDWPLNVNDHVRIISTFDNGLYVNNVDNYILLIEESVVPPPFKPSSPPTTTIFFISTGAVGAALICYSCFKPSSLKGLEKQLKKLADKIPLHIKIRYYNVTISNNSDESIKDIEVKIEVPKTSFLVKVFTQSKVEGNKAILKNLGPKMSREVGFITTTMLPNVKDFNKFFSKLINEPKISVNYNVSGKHKENLLEINKLKLTKENLLIRYKLRMDIFNELSNLKNNFEYIYDTITSRKIKRTEVDYIVLMLQNGSNNNISNVHVDIEVPKTHLIAGRKIFTESKITSGGLWEKSFITINPRVKTSELSGEMKVKIQYILGGKIYNIELKPGENIKMPKNVEAWLIKHSISDKIALIKNIIKKVKRLI